MKLKKRYGTINHVVCIKNVQPDLAGRIVRECSFRNPAYDIALNHSPSGFVAMDIPRELNFAWYYDVDKELFLNRGAHTFLSKHSKHVVDLSHLKDRRIFLPVKFPALRLKLTQEQEQCMDALNETLHLGTRRFGNILFVASTSVGKTILSAAAAARLGQRTLVVCPTDLIIRGWQADLEKAFGLAKSEIGLIKQKSWKVAKHFTLASLQTLGRRKHMWDMLNEQFGTVIVDEVHMVSAPTAFDFVAQSPAAFLIGATATQESRDGGRNLHLEALFGKPIIKLDTYARETATSMKISEVKIVQTDFNMEEQSGNFDWAAYAMALTTDEERNQLIVNNVRKEWEQGRVVLITSKRREHTDVLYDMLKEAGVENVNHINGDTNADRRYTQTLLKLIAQRKATCIVATNSAIQTGANIPALDSIHIAMPIANKRNLEQLLGRMRRKAPGKVEATLTYYKDRLGYADHIYRRILVPVFRRMKLPGYENLFT